MRLLSGQRAWVIQRLSAIYILVAAGVFAVFVASGEPMTFATWREWIAHPFSMVSVLLFFTALFLHSWVGLRDIVLDYVHPVGLRAIVLVVIGLGLLWLEVRVLLILVAARGGGP